MVTHAHDHGLTAAANKDHLNGCMIALMPTEEDAKRLAIKGGEAAADLHLTLYFLGELDAWDEDQKNDLLYCMKLGMLPYCADEPGPVKANVFGAAHWNGGGEKPSWVWNVGDGAGSRRNPLEGPTTESMHSMVRWILEDMHRQPDLPDQFCPWVPHVCAAYSDDLTMIGDLEKGLGPITFDRLRVSFGHEDHDFDLWGFAESLTAGGGMRAPTPTEIAAKVDFAMIDRQWNDAVGSMMGDYARIEHDQRQQIKEQIITAVDSDNLGLIDSLHVDTDDCARLLLDHMVRLANKAGQEMQREAEHQGVRVPPWDLNDAAMTASTATDVLTATARVTARSLGFGLVQSAARRVMSFMGIGKSGRQVADLVDNGLKGLSDASPKDQIGAAMSRAQNAGRVAVLSVAPAGVYLASEALDQNTCVPCRTIDGEEFASLGDARAAYPAGGYINCLGGGRCRGTMIAVWGSGETASAAVEGTGTVGTATETLGGKPNPGTKKDKRLHENDKAADETEALGGKPNPGTKKDKRLDDNQAYDDGCEGDDCEESMDGDPKHFRTDVVTAAWNGASSRFDDAQWKTATAACDTGDGTIKERCFLPHHDPGGALNPDGLAAAAGRANQSGSHTPQAVAKAKAHLRSHYNQLKKPVPENLKATDEEIAAFGTESDYDLTLWGEAVPMETITRDAHGNVVVTYDTTPEPCPKGMQLDPATGECAPIEGGDPAASTAAEGNTAPWEGVLVVEGEATGDGREFAADALTWPEPITPGEVLLRWNKEDSHGGTPTTKAVAVGRIDRIWKDGNKIMGQGVFDLDNPDGAEAYRRVQQKFLRGVSVDADSIANADVEFVWPESSGDDGEDMLTMLFGQPDKVIYHGGRIRAATLCDIPAFIEAYIALTDDDGAVVAGGQALDMIGLVRKRRSSDRMHRSEERHREAVALVAHGGPDWRPPTEWFENPQLSLQTTIHVTDEGRIYGHAAQWGACHIGHLDVCVQPPREDDFPYFLTGELITAEGKPVSVGQITVTTNHADLYAGAGPAKEHYENTGNAVADVAVGMDRIGIWVAGAIRANADPDMVHELRASGEVSGDWRKIGGQYRLVGLLGVNVGGFVVPNMRARVAGGQVQALVAAGRLSVARPPVVRPSEISKTDAYRIVMDDLAAQMMNEGSE